jgi:hypothetical protein
MVISFCIFFPVRPFLGFIALLLTFIVYLVVRVRGARFLEALGSEKVDPPTYFTFFWWGILLAEAVASMILLIRGSR